MSHPIPSTVRADDLLRHLQDLRSGTYEGAVSRGAKEVVYRRGINLLRPVALEILEEANTLFLNGTGNVQMIGPEEDGYGSLVTRFELSWPEQRAARVMRGPNEPLQPVCIVVNYSQGFLHPHLSGSTAGFWPFQVTSAADAGRQRGILAAIVELELHQRIFETDWRILPTSWQLEWEHSCLGKGCRNEEERQARIIEHRGIQNSNKFIIICVRAMLVLTLVMKIVMNTMIMLMIH